MSDRPDRSSVGGTAYLDLRKLAGETGRPTDQLIQLYGLEGFLDRLSRSPHSDNFVLKGGVLLAAYTNRRPTRDIDFAVDQIDGDLDAIRTITNEVLAVSADDGLVFDESATTVESIRDHEIYPSIRAKVLGKLATANVRFHIDINIGDPVWPEPTQIEVPRLLDSPPLRVRGYAVELILAEKIVTTIQRGTANTRWRDFLDIANLAKVEVDQDKLSESIRRVAEHRQTALRPLSVVLDGFEDMAQPRWSAWRRKHKLDEAPESFAELLARVTRFADPYLLNGVL